MEDKEVEKDAIYFKCDYMVEMSSNVASKSLSDLPMWGAKNDNFYKLLFLLSLFVIPIVLIKLIFYFVALLSYFRSLFETRTELFLLSSNLLFFKSLFTVFGLCCPSSLKDLLWMLTFRDKALRLCVKLYYFFWFLLLFSILYY